MIKQSILMIFLFFEVEEYMAQLPNHVVPRINSSGEKFRERQLMLQVNHSCFYSISRILDPYLIIQYVLGSLISFDHARLQISEISPNADK